MESDYAPLLERSDSETEIFQSSLKLKRLERIEAPQKRSPRNGHGGTSALGVLMHILKGNVGTGLLALPLAVRNAGLIGGPFGLAFVAFLAIHCMHLLHRNADILAKRHKCSNIDYAGALNLAVRHGSIKWIQPYHRLAQKMVNLFIFITQFGFCCVYFVFMAENLRQVLEFFECGWIPNEKIMTLLLAIPIFLLTLINSLNWLAPFSMLANIAVSTSVVFIFYFCFTYLSVNPSPFPHLDLYASAATFPTAFGSAVFSFEGIAMVLPLKNSMEQPEKFPATLNVGMTIVTLLYILLGSIGYITFGDTICGSITLNLPEETLYISVKLMYIFAIFVSYGLQFFIPIAVIIENRDWGFCKVFFLKFILVLFTCSLAIAIPDLGDFIALIGACASSLLALVFPPMIDALVSRNGSGLHLTKNIFIILFGVVGGIVGTITSIMSVISVLTSSTGEDECVPIDWLQNKTLYNQSHVIP